MVWYLLWAIISMFAVFGLLESILALLELFALRNVRCVESTSFRVVLKGESENMEYLLNTLSLMAERLDVGKIEATLELVDGGLSENARREVQLYCEKNHWVRFTQEENGGII